MENLILKAKSKYDYNTLKEYNKICMNTSWINRIISIIAVMLLISSFFPITDLALRIFAFIVSIIWFIKIFTFPSLYAKRVLKTSKIHSNIEIETLFYEDKIEINSIRDGKIVGNAKMLYSDVYKVVDTKNAMYIFIL